jgi:hypothetical protein
VDLTPKSQIRDNSFDNLDELFNGSNSLQSLQGLQDIPMFDDLAPDAEMYWMNRIRMTPEDRDDPILWECLIECLTNEWLRDR